MPNEECLPPPNRLLLTAPPSRLAPSLQSVFGNVSQIKDLTATLLADIEDAVTVNDRATGPCFIKLAVSAYAGVCAAGSAAGRRGCCAPFREVVGGPRC